jgi:hypothetical protein
VIIPWRAVAGAVVVAAAFGAGWQTNGWQIENGILRAEREQREAADASNRTIIESYRTELDRTRNRPPRRVYLCPDLPAATGATADPAAAGLPPPARRDIGDLLAECRDYAAQLGALINAVQVQHP